MTTLAIIGNGLLGRSLLYVLAKEQKSFEKITLIHSETFAFPCSRHSTAIVAPRGLSRGLSPLGDELLDAYERFREHILLDAPRGVEEVAQFTGATSKLENFKTRYPQGIVTDNCAHFSLRKPTYVATEKAFMIDPVLYNDWLLSEAKSMEQYHLEIIQDFVTEVSQSERIQLKTQQGRLLNFDKVIFAGGNYNRFWAELVPESVLKTSKPVPGSYLEFNHLDWEIPSFSLTLDGDNLVWNRPLKRLFVGSTTEVTNLTLPDWYELKAIYSRLQEAVELSLPDITQAVVRTGIREKARRREPYTIKSGNLFFMGGMYKNGYSLALKMSKDFSRQHL